MILTAILLGFYILLQIVFRASHTAAHILQHVLLHHLIHFLDHHGEVGAGLFGLFIVLLLLTIFVAPFLGFPWIAADAAIVVLILWRLMDVGPTGH